MKIEEEKVIMIFWAVEYRMDEVSAYTSWMIELLIESAVASEMEKTPPCPVPLSSTSIA